MSAATPLFAEPDLPACAAPAGGPDPLLMPPWGGRPRLRLVSDGGFGPRTAPAAGPRPPAAPPADVTVLRPPSPSALARPLRLTRRGVVALAAAIGALAVGLVWLAAASAPTAAAAPSRVPARVTVRAGDTLWSIATRVAPQRDPRTEVAALQHLNRNTGTDLVPGQVLRVR